MKNTPLGSMSFESGSLQVERARREHRIYSLGVTKASAAADRIGGVTCGCGQHASAEVSPTEGLTARTGDFAIANLCNGG